MITRLAQRAVVAAEKRGNRVHARLPAGDLTAIRPSLQVLSKLFALRFGSIPAPRFCDRRGAHRVAVACSLQPFLGGWH